MEVLLEFDLVNEGLVIYVLLRRWLVDIHIFLLQLINLLLSLPYLSLLLDRWIVLGYLVQDLPWIST